MNAVEIEEAVSELAGQPFEAAEFPYRFIAAYGAKDTILKRLRKGDTNQSDAGGVLWRNNIHIAVAPAGQVSATLAILRTSAKTTSAKAKFILATDGDTVEAEDLVGGDVIACAYADLPRHFATFLPLAGISTVKEIKNNPVDVKATGRLNRLYVALLKDNPDWATDAKRAQLNQFMAQLIFCFFAEDTDIFHGSYKFTPTVERMTSGQADNTREVIAQLFRAMGTRPEHRPAGSFPSWADGFPYVNGGYLFNGDSECPHFSRTARAYLLRAGELDWKEINPDIFGSMIQAVADDGERGELGMHYTSVPNILKVLNPLFLDSLREQLAAAGDSKAKLRNLRRRLGQIRVFDPACGSGNFLVIAYKQMREIEAAVVARLGGEESLKLADRRSVIPLVNFYGIEIKGFAAEIARLALLIAEFQADCLYLSQQEARAMVLPLHKTGQITVGNALRIDWLEVCPPVGATLGQEQDLAGPTGRLALEENGLDEGGRVETYICGNPPYAGHQQRTPEQRQEMEDLFGPQGIPEGDLDYVLSWFLLWERYAGQIKSDCAFVATNSICQGRQVPRFWKVLFDRGVYIPFAHRSFAWKNNATNNAAVVCVIVGASFLNGDPCKLYSDGILQECTEISAYLTPSKRVFVEPSSKDRLSPQLSAMRTGNMPIDGGHFIVDNDEALKMIQAHPEAATFLRRYAGSRELSHGYFRYCIWIDDDQLDHALRVQTIASRIELCRTFRQQSSREATKKIAVIPHRFAETHRARDRIIALPNVSSENREYRTPSILDASWVISNLAFGLYDGSLWELGILSTRIHHLWIEVTCGKLKTDFRYSNTLGWNTFPVPKLTEQDKADLTRTAENILLAREAHFPATIADLYDPKTMPDDLRRAHDDNDAVLERIYIGRRFRNDTERLEKLFEMYTKMTADAGPKAKKGRQAA